MLCMQTFQSYKMYIGVIIVTPTVVCLWVYLLVLIADSFFPTVIYQKNRDSVAVQNNVQDVVWKNCSNNTKMKIEEKVKKKNFHVPKFMLELYENNRIEGANIQKPDVVRSLIPTHAGTIDNNEIFDMPSENHMLVFDLPASDSDETFIRAELKILTLLIFDNKRQKGVKRILKVSMYDDSSKNLLGFQEVSIHHLNNTWISLDLTGPVNQILKSNSKKKFLSIIVTVLAFVPSDAGGTLKLSLVPEKDTFEFDYPVLLSSYICVKEDKNEFLNHSKNNDGVRKNRVKRSIEDDYEEESNKLWDEDISPKKYSLKKLKRARNACKRKPMYVDFEEINYDSWIVQPKGYEAYQCFGRCFYPVAEHLNPTKHAIVQALLHSVTPSKVSRSCCVPTILGPISILYVDANGILTYRYAYRDMVVVECGCR